jgi:hypothetical protein
MRLAVVLAVFIASFMVLAAPGRTLSPSAGRLMTAREMLGHYGVNGMSFDKFDTLRVTEYEPGQSIPRIIHQMWSDDDLPLKLREFSRSWEQMHPEWQYRYSVSICLFVYLFILKKHKTGLGAILATNSLFGVICL